ncbi:MAG: rhomboid family intramembrane serine protease [Deltaproteobacteria bacterium]|nr:rhomboid family intramembrane serine protease [Deltaproteobacteria bacterium]
MILPRPLRRVPAWSLGAAALTAGLQALVSLRAGGQEAAVPHLLLVGGARSGALVREGEAWRLLSSAFLHGSTAHLVTNLLGILALGWYVEGILGTWRFLVLYLAAAAGAGGLSMALGDSTSVGASGVLFGLMGAAAAHAVRHRRTLPPLQRTYAILVPSVAAAASLGYGWSLEAVDSASHLGGLLAGLAFGAASPREAPPPMRLPSPPLLAAACLGLALLASALAHSVDRLNGHLPPLDTRLEAVDLPRGLAWIPADGAWTRGRLDPSGRCEGGPGLDPAGVLREGGVLCCTDPLYAAVLVGSEEAMAQVSIYQEAFLREHGDEPRAFQALELRFHRRGDGLVTGLAFFGPLRTRYEPLFQAITARPVEAALRSSGAR